MHDVKLNLLQATFEFHRLERVPMWKRVRRILLGVLFIYLGVVVVVAALEGYLMYPAPTAAQGDWDPSWLEYEDVEITTQAGNKIHGWYCEHPNATRVILLCHGNGEHVAYMAEELEFVREKYQASVLAFDYRGYGKSPGKPFETGILADGDAAQEWLAERAGVEPGDVYLWGRSLGGAVAVHLAAKNGAKGLVLDRTFNSMVDVAASHYPWLPVRLLLTNRYPSEKRIKNYNGPLLQFHGQPDRVVPFRFGRALFESAPGEDKTFVESEDMGHNSPWPAKYFAQVEQFFQAIELLEQQAEQQQSDVGVQSDEGGEGSP
ncbi:MAG: alpha/beta hydrolase [Planctomycetota bacterium]